MKTRTSLLCLLLALAVCAPATGRTGDADNQSLLEADRAWSQTAGGSPEFAARLASDVFFLPPDVARTQGDEEFMASADALLNQPGVELTWSPDMAEVSKSGDLGYTIGTFKLTLKGPDGKPVIRVGKYMTAWRRLDGGDWKVVADMFNFDAPISGEEVAAGSRTDD